jgi:hypothetical protein
VPIAIANLKFTDDYDYKVTKCGKRCLSIDLNLKKNVIDDEDLTITVNMPNVTTTGKTSLTVTGKFKVSKSTYPLIWKG